MKKLVIVVVVLLAIGLLAPGAIGKLAEKRVNAGLDKIIEQAPYLAIAKREWKSGWFRSEQLVTFTIAKPWADVMTPKGVRDILDSQQPDEDAEAAAAMDADGIEAAADTPEGVPESYEQAGEAASPEDSDVDVPSATPEPVSFTVRNEILHGPVLGLSGFGLARVDTHFELSEEARRELRQLFGEKPAFELWTRVGFFGGGKTTLISEGRKVTRAERQDELEYETFKTSISYSRNADSFELDGKWPRFLLKSGDGGSVQFTGFTIDGDAERVMGDLYDGEFDFRIKEIKVVSAGSSDPMIVENAHYEGDIDTKDNLVSMGLKMGTGAIKGYEQLEQTNIDIKEVHYDFSLRRLHAPTIEKMSQAYRTLYTQPFSDASEVEQKLFGPLKESAGDFLQHDPELSLDRIGFVTSDGEMVAKGVIKLVGATVQDFEAAGGMGAIAKIHADITIEAAQKLIEKFPNGATMAGGAVDAGYAKRQGDKLVCRIEFKNAQLTINGKPQAIPGLGGPPPGSMEGGMPPQE